MSSHVAQLRQRSTLDHTQVLTISLDLLCYYLIINNYMLTGICVHGSACNFCVYLTLKPKPKALLMHRVNFSHPRLSCPIIYFTFRVTRIARCAYFTRIFQTPAFQVVLYPSVKKMRRRVTLL